ncbi:hypothetical protein LCGC14_2124900 [marine sediment metagenome]|uniref:Uncharacterized protein n=1 Tax=marine sediment metagenome TaxID=412755 RepID=A0A0F9E339_9ZZZZ
MTIQSTHASKLHTRCQKSEYVQPSETETFETVVANIRTTAIAQNEDELEKLLYQLDEAKIDRDDNAFEKRQIKNTLLNQIEDALDGNNRAYKLIVRTCDQL